MAVRLRTSSLTVSVTFVATLFTFVFVDEVESAMLGVNVCSQRYEDLSMFGAIFCFKSLSVHALELYPGAKSYCLLSTCVLEFPGLDWKIVDDDVKRDHVHTLWRFGSMAAQIYHIATGVCFLIEI